MGVTSATASMSITVFLPLELLPSLVLEREHHVSDLVKLPNARAEK